MNSVLRSHVLHQREVLEVLVRAEQQLAGEELPQDRADDQPSCRVLTMRLWCSCRAGRRAAAVEYVDLDLRGLGVPRHRGQSEGGHRTDEPTKMLGGGDYDGATTRYECVDISAALNDGEGRQLQILHVRMAV